MLLEVSLCEEPLNHGARVHGFSTRDIRARMLVRQRTVERSGDALAGLRWCDLPERDDEDENGLASIRRPDPRLILYGRPELLVL
jgi:hypothetical protein